MSWKTAFLSVLFLFFGVMPSVTAADESIEDMEPKRTLTEEQRKQADELLEKIKAEKAKVDVAKKPLEAIEEQGKEPNEELDKIGRAVSDIQKALSDFDLPVDKAKPERSDAGKVKAKMKAESEKLGSGLGGKYYTAAEAVLNAKIALKAEKDEKKKVIAQKKVTDSYIEMEKILAKGTEKLQDKLDKLRQRAQAEQEKIKLASKELESMRDYLRILYGYNARGTGVFGNDSGSKDENMMQWIEEQGRFIGMMSAYGYDNLAESFFAKLKESNNPFTDKPLTDTEKNNFNKVGARLSLQKSTNAQSIKDRILFGQESITLYNDVIKLLLPQTPTYYDAMNDLVSAKFAIAGSLANMAFDYGTMNGTFIEAGATPDPKAKDKAAATVGAGPFAAADLDKMDEATLAQAAANYAESLYESGIEAMLPIQEKLAAAYIELIDLYITANEKNDKLLKAKYVKMLNKVGSQKVRIQHSMETAYANWPYLYAPGNSKRQDIADQGSEFVETNLLDYQETWDFDKQAYGFWMLATAALPDPVLEKTEDDKPMPKFDTGDEEEWKELSGAEKNAEKFNLMRYPWISDRVDNIFNWYIVGKKRGAESSNTFTQYGRAQGLLRWAEARTQMAMGAFRIADAEKDPARKAALLAHAQKLADSAGEALDEFNKSSTKVGVLDMATRCRGLLEVGNKYYLSLAARAVRNGDKDAASQYLRQAMASAATARTVAEGGWRSAAASALLAINQFRTKYELSGGDNPEEWAPTMLVTEAESCLRNGIKAERAGDEKEANKQLNRCRDLYLILLNKARKLSGKDKRDAILPRALYNLGAAAFKVGDIDTAFIANQAIAQEFRNDFEDPTKNYDPNKYPNAASYYRSSLNNLRAAGFAMTTLSKGPYAKKNYVDALLLNVRASGKGEDYVALIDTMANKMKEYDSAVAFIDSVPEENDYYRITQLMAASIYLTMIEKSSKEIAGIDTELNPQPDEDGKIAEELIVSPKVRERLEKRKAALKADLARYRDAAARYAKLFIDLHQKALQRWEGEKAQGVNVTEAVEKIRNQERVNLLQAMLIPLSLAFGDGDYTQVLRMVPDYYAAIDAQKNISEEDKENYKVSAAWLAFNSQYRAVDYAKDDVAACVKNLEATQAIQETLAKADIENKYQSDAASVLGGAWLRLSSRAKEKGQAEEEKKFALAAVNWLDKAESRIYEQVGTGVKMGTTLTEQKLYGRAENVLAKVIEFWGESRFTPMSLYQPGQGAAGMAQMNPAVAGMLSGSLQAAKTATAATTGNDALIKQLNEVIQTVKFEEHADDFNKALDAAVEANKENTRLTRALEQGRALARGFAKPDKSLKIYLDKLPHLNQALAPTGDQRGRLNRLLLEAAYPKTLFLQQAVPMVASPAIMLQQAQTVDRNYTSETGRRKAALIVALMAPIMLTDSQREVVYGPPSEKGKGGIFGELSKKLEETNSDEEKQNIQYMQMGLENPLLVSVYGRPDKKGNLRDRSFGRARVTIKSILDYDAENPTEEKLPIETYLKDLDKALAFDNQILFAKKDYARAMVENGNFAKAEKYVLELCQLFPGDLALKMDLGDIYTAMATFQTVDGKRERRPFTLESAADFQKGFKEFIGVYNSTRDGMPQRTVAYLKLAANEVSALEARVKTGGAMRGEQVVKYSFFDFTTGEYKNAAVPLKSCDAKGKQWANDIYRYMQKSDPKFSDEEVAQFQSLLDRLERIGYRPNIVKDSGLNGK